MNDFGCFGMEETHGVCDVESDFEFHGEGNLIFVVLEVFLYLEGEKKKFR